MPDNDISSPNEGLIPDDPSNDLLASIETPEEGEAIDFGAIVEQANKIRENYPLETRVAGSLSIDMLTSSEYVFKIASELYNSLARQAKRYMKNWCAINNYRQKWSRHRELYKVNYKYTSEYNKFVYDISLYTDKAREDIKPLVVNSATAEDAMLQAAYKCGFLESLEYKATFKAYPHETIALILNDHSILEKVKALAKLEELRVQISSDTNQEIEYKQKINWLAKIEEEISFIKGAI